MERSMKQQQRKGAAETASAEPQHLRQDIGVKFSFPVLFTRNVFAAENQTLDLLLRGAREQKDAKLLAFLDAGVAQANPGLAARLAAKLATLEDISHRGGVRIVPGGEQAKDGLGVVDIVGSACSDNGIDRHSYILAIGGGAMLDAVGFGASIVHRGIRLLRLPTTVLSQNDAGIGVKNGVNALGQKNFYGCFMAPFAVVDDLDLLDTLPERDWRAGIAEAVKVACIRDATFLNFLCREAAPLGIGRDRTGMERLVRECARLHLEHTGSSGDPFETGSARPLDFGHWSAHWLEMASGNRVNHGEAVAIGLGADILYAAATGLVSRADALRVIGCLKDAGFRMWEPELNRRDGSGRPEVFAGLARFREHLGGELTLVLPAPLGNSREIHDVDLDVMTQCLTELERLA